MDTRNKSEYDGILRPMSEIYAHALRTEFGQIVVMQPRHTQTCSEYPLMPWVHLFF